MPFILLNLVGKLFLSFLPTKYSLTGTLRAHGWFFLHWGEVMAKRSVMRSEQTVHESDVMRMMTAKLTNGESILGRSINAVSVIYCRMTALKFREVVR
ncbi:MAG: hypothetical protein HUU02_16035 [Bacteroidetes bacterium]|nr:hypothetical protein [Bacteroidota bacterium]